MTAFQQPDETEIRAQLARVLASVEFRDAPVLSKMLCFIIEAALEGTASRLNATVLAREALGKPAGFKSSQDPSVRVAANRMRRSLRLYYSGQGRRDDVEISIETGTFEPTITYQSKNHRNIADHALETVDQYQSVASKQALSKTLRKVESGLTAHPENARLLAAKADLLMDSHKHGIGNGRKVLDLAHATLECAREFDADDGYIVLVSAFAELLDGHTHSVEALAINLVEFGTDPRDKAFGVWARTLVSDQRPDLGQADANLFDRHDLPGWIHHAPFLLAYTDGDYERALSSAMAFGMPHFFWSGIDRTAALGQLGLKEAARRELERTINQCPWLLYDTDRILSAYMPRDDVRASVREGLEKAGLSSLL